MRGPRLVPAAVGVLSSECSPLAVCKTGCRALDRPRCTGETRSRIGNEDILDLVSCDSSSHLIEFDTENTCGCRKFSLPHAFANKSKTHTIIQRKYLKGQCSSRIQLILQFTCKHLMNLNQLQIKSNCLPDTLPSACCWAPCRKYVAGAFEPSNFRWRRQKDES